MMEKRFVRAALLATVLLALVIVPSSTQQGETYDPWKDLNDDGTIDVYDLHDMALSYGTSGEPINKTGLLLELQSRIESLEARAPQTTTAFTDLTLLVSDLEPHNLVSIQLSLQRNASVLAVGETWLEGVPDVGIHLGLRLNTTSREWNVEWRRSGDLMNGVIVGLHHLWTNLTAGDYTVAWQYWIYKVDPALGQAFSNRLTLLVIY